MKEELVHCVRWGVVGPQGRGRLLKPQGNTGNTQHSAATCLGLSRPHVTTHHLTADPGNRSSEVLGHQIHAHPLHLPAPPHPPLCSEAQGLSAQISRVTVSWESRCFFLGALV